MFPAHWMSHLGLVLEIPTASFLRGIMLILWLFCLLIRHFLKFVTIVESGRTKEWGFNSFSSEQSEKAVWMQKELGLCCGICWGVVCYSWWREIAYSVTSMSIMCPLWALKAVCGQHKLCRDLGKLKHVKGIRHLAQHVGQHLGSSHLTLSAWILVLVMVIIPSSCPCAFWEVPGDGSTSPTWQTWIKSRTPGFAPPQPWRLQVIREWTSE